MKTQPDEPLGINDLDPDLARRVKEKIASVRSIIGANAERTLTSENARRVAGQAAEQNGEMPIVTIHDHERADAAIRRQFVADNSSGIGFAAKLCVNFFLPFLLLATILGNLWIADVGPPPTSLGPINVVVMGLIIATICPIAAARGRRGFVLAGVIAGVLPCVANTFGERAYAAAVSEVFNGQSTLGVSEARTIIVSLNSLLASERELSIQREAIVRSMQSQSLHTLETEREQLRVRRDDAADPVARQTLDESLRLCEGRLERARQIAPVRERIEAQQEMIRQTMASVQTSLASLSIASMETIASDSAIGPKTSLLETARDLQIRAVAVEKAVQEVAALHAR